MSALDKLRQALGGAACEADERELGELGQLFGTGAHSTLGLRHLCIGDLRELLATVDRLTAERDQARLEYRAMSDSATSNLRRIEALDALIDQLVAERDEARAAAGFQREAYWETDLRLMALRDQVERGGCAAARWGETTHECRTETPCGLCRLRAERDLARNCLKNASEFLAQSEADARNLVAERNKARVELRQAKQDAVAALLGYHMTDEALSRVEQYERDLAETDHG